MTDFAAIQTLVLSLSPAMRGELANKLLESLESDRGEEWEYVEDGTTWEQEIQRRIDDIDSGREKTIPWEEVKKMIAEDCGDAVR